MRLALLGAVLIGAAAGWGVADSVYVVGAGEQATLTRFGRPMTPAVGPGLHLKAPVVERVVIESGGERLVRLGPSEMQDAKGALVKLDGYLAIRVADPEAYAVRVGATASSDVRLRTLLADSLRGALGSAGVGDNADRVAAAALAALRRRVSADRLGVEMTDVQLTAFGPPDKETEAAGRRLQEAETLQAATIRADAEARKRDLTEIADRDAAALRDDGERRALEVRGQGDAERAAILAAAYGQDPDFARFFRRLEAYDDALDPQTTTVVISPDDAFMKLFEQGPPAGRR